MVIVSCALLHCSKRDGNTFATVPAPKQAVDLGFIVTASESEIASIQEKFPAAGIRSLNQAQNLFEINHVSQKDLVTVLKNKSVVKNEFMESLASANQKKWSLNRLAKNTSADALAALETCQQTELGPTVDADISFDMTSLTINLGDAVTITAKGEANATVGGDVKFMWDLMPPGFSQQGFAQGVAGAQTFTPDSVGLYRVALIAQGTDLSCNFIVIPILVTANPAISTELELAGEPPASLFKHIDDIKARDAWTQSRGKDVVVAVLDSGLNYNHPSIRNNIQTKNADSADNADSDGNGLQDDFIGWDFVNGDNMPFDDEGHGTHVAGLIASPLAGVAPDAKILPVKVLNAAGGSDLATVVAGIHYAIDNGAKIINASLGFEAKGNPPPQPLLDAIERARTLNITVLAAAGNGDAQTGIGYDIELRPDYPASVQSDNLIAVAATAEGKITSYSNFSAKLVHFAAPGGNENEFIVSLATQNPANSVLAAQSGTSMATPVAAGAAALLLAAKPSLTPLEIRNVLMETGDELETLKGKIISGRQINALQALNKVLDLNPAVNMN